jgi:hypothetical protein
MKIIITETKLNKTINKWLSDKYGDLKIYDHDNQPWVLYVDKNSEVKFLYHTKDNELYVSKDIIKFLYNIFFIDEKQIQSICNHWFEEHTGLKSYKTLSWNFDEDWKKVVRWETKKRLS